MAALYSAVFLVFIVFAGNKVIAYIPLAAIAGVLILVGYSLIDLKAVKKKLRTKQEAAIFALTFVSALALGITTGVFTGLLFSLIIYLWYASTPNIVIEKHTARDGRPVTVVTIDGNLFFGSARHVECALRKLGESGEKNILLLKTEHITYLDVPGATMLAAEAQNRWVKGDDIYIYVTRSNVLDVLENPGCLHTFGESHIIHRDLHHPMKDLLFLARFADLKPDETKISVTSKENISMEAFAKRLRLTRLLGPLSTDTLAGRNRDKNSKG